MVAQGVGTLVEFAASGLSCVHVREVLRRCRRPSLVFERFAEHCACVIRVATERGQEIDLCEQLCQALIRNGTPFSRWDREPGDTPATVKAYALHFRSGWEGPRLGEDGEPVQLLFDPAASAYDRAFIGWASCLAMSPIAGA